MKEFKGVVDKWNDDKGFGFIISQDFGKVFFHISKMHSNRRPIIGDSVFFLLEYDEQRRPVAGHVRHAELTLDTLNGEHSKSSKDQTKATIKIGVFDWLFFIGLMLLPIFGAFEFYRNGIIWVVPTYFIFSVITVWFYKRDKNNALKGDRRIPENTLHLLEFFGGWFGAYWAQKVFRHKTKKLSYQLIYWLVILFHQVFWFDWVFLDKKYFEYIVSGQAAVDIQLMLQHFTN